MAGWAAYAKTPGSLQKQPCHLPDETGVQLLCAARYDIYTRPTIAVLSAKNCCEKLTKAQHKLAAAQTKMDGSMFNISHGQKDEQLGQ